MTAEAWAAGAAIAAALVALGALYFNWRSTQAAIRAAGATEEQTNVQRQQTEIQRQQTDVQEQQTEIQREQTAIQRQLHRDAAQPYVWVDVRPDDAQGTLLNLVVGNSGPTVATDVRVKVDPPLQPIAGLAERIEVAQAQLARGLKSLPPGRMLIWLLGQGFNLIPEQGSREYTFTVTANGPFGEIPPLTYVVDLSDLRGVMDQPAGSLHQLTKAVKDLTSKVDELRRHHRS